MKSVFKSFICCVALSLAPGSSTIGAQTVVTYDRFDNSTAVTYKLVVPHLVHYQRQPDAYPTLVFEDSFASQRPTINLGSINAAIGLTADDCSCTSIDLLIDGELFHLNAARSNADFTDPEMFFWLPFKLLEKMASASTVEGRFEPSQIEFALTSEQRQEIGKFLIDITP